MTWHEKPLSEGIKMTEADYQHECGRAELLGLPKPSREEFFSRQKEIPAAEKSEEEEITVEQEEEAGIRQEGFRRIGGGLDELNSILSSTQKKLNRFKSVCGSFTNILKLHIGSKTEGENEPQNELSTETDSTTTKPEERGKVSSESPYKPGNIGGDSQLDKLDSLISKAERAELSLSSQNKQMKKFLN